MNNFVGTEFNSETKIWSGPKKKAFYGADMTLGEVSAFELRKNSHKILQITDTTGEQLTGGELLKRGKSVALNLMRFGLKKGDVVGVSAENTTHLSVVILGAFLCGTPINLIYSNFEKDIIKMIFKITEPKVLFIDAKNYTIMQEVSNELQLNARIFIMDQVSDNCKYIEELIHTNDDLENVIFPCTELTGADTAAILCSSGTTGIPKGICCSHGALLNQQIMIDLEEDSAIFSFNSMNWITGFFGLISSFINGVKRVITNKPFTPEYLLELIEKHKITHLIVSTIHMKQLLQNVQPNTGSRLSKTRSILCGGSQVDAGIAQKIRGLLGEDHTTSSSRFCPAYGSTEITGSITKFDSGWGKENSVGKLFYNVEVHIVNEDGERVGPNEKGVVHVRMPCVWPGYYKNTEATEKVYVDGWLNTGDIGYFDDEGFLYLCGRENDIFKSYRFHIYPGLVEETIAQLPGVLEICVFGVPQPEGYNLAACAIVRTNNDAGKALTSEQVRQHVEKTMPSIYALKGGVYFVEFLPKTPSNKLQRHKILDMIKKNSLFD